MGFGKRKSEKLSESKENGGIEDILDYLNIPLSLRNKIRNKIKENMPLSLRNYIKEKIKIRDAISRRRDAISGRDLKKDIEKLFPGKKIDTIEQTLDTIKKIKIYLPETETNAVEKVLEEMIRLLATDEEDGIIPNEEITDEPSSEDYEITEFKGCTPYLDNDSGNIGIGLHWENYRVKKPIKPVKERPKERSIRLKKYVAHKAISAMHKEAKKAYNKKEYEKADNLIAMIEGYANETGVELSRDIVMLKKEVLERLPIKYMINKYNHLKGQISELAKDIVTQGSKSVRRYNLEEQLDILETMKDAGKLINKRIPNDLKGTYRKAKREAKRRLENKRRALMEEMEEMERRLEYLMRIKISSR